MVLGEKEEPAVEVPEGLRREFKKATEDFKALDAELSALRDKEQNFENGQEGFLPSIQDRGFEVQAVKDKIGEWENRNRESVLEKERVAHASRRTDASDRAGGPWKKSSKSYRADEVQPRNGGDVRDGAAHVPFARRSRRDRRLPALNSEKNLKGRLARRGDFLRLILQCSLCHAGLIPCLHPAAFSRRVPAGSAFPRRNSAAASRFFPSS